jgi:formamidopyrimidine-DNA glycosylase
MPELPEVEVLVRHLRPRLRGQRICSVEVLRAKVLAPTPVSEFRRTLRGARFVSVTRRGKYLLFSLSTPRETGRLTLLGHLGMTGRIYLASRRDPLPRHTAVVLKLGRHKLIYEDTRYFGRLTLDSTAVVKLGPEPLDGDFDIGAFGRALKRSRQAIKVKLLDQQVVAGVGNIYASEALFRAGISPKLAARRLGRAQVKELYRAIRSVLAEAIKWGSTVPLNYSGRGKRDGLFYFGGAPGAPDFYEERLRVYDREGQPCPNCGAPIRRMVQAARSTYFCPRCQRA